MAPTVTFLRHAESVGNAAVKARGEEAMKDKSLCDCGLTEKGFAQARCALDPDTLYDVIYCSPALRCRQTLLTAMPAATEVPVRVDWRLAEGRGWAEFNELAPFGDGMWPQAWDVSAAADQRPAHETIGEVARRMQQWWLAVSDEFGNTDKHILVVSHSWPIQLWASDWPEEKVKLGNAESHTFRNAAY